MPIEKAKKANIFFTRVKELTLHSSHGIPQCMHVFQCVCGQWVRGCDEGSHRKRRHTQETKRQAKEIERERKTNPNAQPTPKPKPMNHKRRSLFTALIRPPNWPHEFLV